MKAENKVLGLACLLTLIHYTGAYRRVPVLPLSALEPALLTQPTVAETAWVGAPHGELGEEVAAYVALRSGAPALCATADPGGEDTRARRAMTENEFYVIYALMPSQPLSVRSVGCVQSP